MTENLISKSSIIINVPITKVWDALINPSIIKQYMFGTEVVSDWKEGSPIVWKGVWKGKPYEDKGVILKIVPEKIFQCTHFSPLSGVPDVQESYHTLTYELSPRERENTHVLLSQDNNSTEEDRKHSEGTWDAMLAGMKKLLES